MKNVKQKVEQQPIAKGVFVQLPELAKILGVSHPTIHNYVRYNDCPVAVRGSRGKPHIFDTAKVIDWLENRAINAYVAGYRSRW